MSDAAMSPLRANPNRTKPHIVPYGWNPATFLREFAVYMPGRMIPEWTQVEPFGNLAGVIEIYRNNPNVHSFIAWDAIGPSRRTC